MSRSQAVSLAVILMLSACTRRASLPPTSADAAQLRWLEHADVAADFRERVEHQHDMRFVSVYAFSTPTAFGLDDTTEVQQFIQQHGERHIEGTTDIITSTEQQRLLRKAYEYTKHYNTLLLRYLRDHPNI